MTDAAWERLTDTIDTQVGIDRHGRFERPLEDRPELQEKVQFIEFERNGDRLRLERATGPAIIDRKTHYSSRPGAANRIETIYDVNEIAHRVRLLRKDGEEWEELDPSTLQL
jgi:hypothetical protein